MESQRHPSATQAKANLMLAYHWLLLNNLINGWTYWTNMDRVSAKDALVWAEEQGYAIKGRITDEGRGFFLANQHKKVTE